jgi:hypothetical protein
MDYIGIFLVLIKKEFVEIDRPPNGFTQSIGLKKVVAWIVWILSQL